MLQDQIEFAIQVEIDYWFHYNYNNYTSINLKPFFYSTVQIICKGLLPYLDSRYLLQQRLAKTLRNY